MIVLRGKSDGRPQNSPSRSTVHRQRYETTRPRLILDRTGAAILSAGAVTVNPPNLPPICAHRPAVQARQIFAKQNHAHRDRTTHTVLPLLGRRVALEKFPRYAAMA